MSTTPPENPLPPPNPIPTSADEDDISVGEKSAQERSTQPNPSPENLRSRTARRNSVSTTSSNSDRSWQTVAREERRVRRGNITAEEVIRLREPGFQGLEDPDALFRKRRNTSRATSREVHSPSSAQESRFVGNGIE